MEALRKRGLRPEDLEDVPELDLGRMRRGSPRFLKTVREAVQDSPPVRKQQLTIRLDADVFHWLRGLGKGYQTKLNRILRAAMDLAQQR